MAKPAQYDLVADQLNGIRHLLTMKGYRTDLLGSVDDQLDVSELRARMRADPEGTEYIVFLNTPDGFDPHYNYAIIENRQPRFYDFQPNYPEGAGPKTEARPIWPADRAGSGSACRCVAIRVRRNGRTR